MASLKDPRVLLGRWRLDRLVDDRRGGSRSRVLGTLELSQEAPGVLRWHEDGQWRRAGGAVEVHRLLRLRASGDTGAVVWSVYFEDGRLFHAWTPDSEVVHPCGADTYRGRVSGTSSGWQVRWDVSGPAKDYSMTSVLDRA